MYPFYSTFEAKEDEVTAIKALGYNIEKLNAVTYKVKVACRSKYRRMVSELRELGHNAVAVQISVDHAFADAKDKLLGGPNYPVVVNLGGASDEDREALNEALDYRLVDVGDTPQVSFSCEQEVIEAVEAVRGIGTPEMARIHLSGTLECLRNEQASSPKTMYVFMLPDCEDVSLFGLRPVGFSKSHDANMFSVSEKVLRYGVPLLESFGLEDTHLYKAFRDLLDNQVSNNG